MSRLLCLGIEPSCSRKTAVCRPRGNLVAIDPVPPGAPDPHDLVRDLACELGVGLVPIQADHRRIEDVFSEGGAHVGHPA